MSEKRDRSRAVRWGLGGAAALAAVASVGLLAATQDHDEHSAEADAASSTSGPDRDTEGPDVDEPVAAGPADQTPPNSGDTTAAPSRTSPPTTTEDDPGSETTAFAAQVDEGLAMVGADVVPGLYEARVPEQSEGCWWERLEGLDARYADTVAAGEAAAGARVVVEVLDTDEAFRSTGCGPWQPYVPSDQPAVTIGEGTWLVGTDIAAGRYRSTGPESAAGECSWERRLGFSDSFYDIAQSDTVTEPVELEIESSDVAFTSRGCGNWEPVE